LGVIIWLLLLLFIGALYVLIKGNKSVKKTLEKKSDEIPNPETKKDFELENHLDTKTDKSSPKKISTFEQIVSTVGAILLLGGLLFAAMVIKDDTRCDNTGPFPLFTGCEYRKEKVFIYKTLGLTGSGYTQKNYDKNVHALNGKEFCSNYCAKDWYRKL